MDKKNIFYNENSFSFLFLVIPIVMLLIGYLVYPYPPSDFTLKLIQIPIFLGLIILGAGFFIKNDALASKLKIIGWMIFAFYWSTQPKPLYLNENGDVFNASVCIIGVFILFYFAYHEWLSI
ncbi:MAG: hypothetical protein QHH15_04335, partial [Candidatus Thermoplasmatota archaeon]|nr:hypothetical protein [Candidatus Thermoplasmatota archaeon]